MAHGLGLGEAHLAYQQDCLWLQAGGQPDKTNLKAQGPCSPQDMRLSPQLTNLVREGFETGPHRVTAAELGGLKAADDVLQGCSHNEVFLLQPQLLTLEELQTQGHCGASSTAGN